MGGVLAANGIRNSGRVQDIMYHRGELGSIGRRTPAVVGSLLSRLISVVEDLFVSDLDGDFDISD